MLRFDAWLVAGLTRYSIDGVQAWAAVAAFDVQEVEGTTPTVVAALKGLSLYLQYLYSYFNTFLSMSSVSPIWIQQQLDATGLTAHETWLNRAMLLQDLYYKGGAAFLPPNWSQELRHGASVVSEFGQMSARRLDGLVQQRIDSHDRLYTHGLLPLTVLFFAMFAALMWQCCMLTLSPPSASDRQAARRSVARFLHTHVEGPARAASAGLEWMQHSMPTRQLNKPAFREPALFLRMHAGALSRGLARMQAAAQAGPAAQPPPAACDVRFLLSRVACQYRGISRASVHVDCDAAVPGTLSLPAMSLFHVLSCLVDAAVQRSEHSDVHVTCRYLPPLPTASLAQWYHASATGARGLSTLKACAAQLGQGLRRSSVCGSGAPPTCGCLLFSIVDGGDTLPQAVLSAMSHGSAAAPPRQQHAGAVSDAVASARHIATRDFRGVFLASTHPEHEDGTCVLFTLALSPADTQRVQAAGQALLERVAQREGPGLITASRSQRAVEQKHSVVIPHFGRIPLRWPCRKLYSTREDNLKPPVQQFYSTHYRRLAATDALSDTLQVTTCVIVEFDAGTAQRLRRIAAASGRLVLVLPSGLAALSAWQRRTTAMVDCDVLLMRVALPQLSGPTVAHMLLQQRFNGKVVLYHAPGAPPQPVHGKLDVLPPKWSDDDVARRLTRRNRTASALAQDRVVMPGS